MDAQNNGMFSLCVRDLHLFWGHLDMVGRDQPGSGFFLVPLQYGYAVQP